jgi:hypothetical protein
MANLNVLHYKNTLDRWAINFKRYYDFYVYDGFNGGRYIDMDACIMATIDPNCEVTVPLSYESKTLLQSELETEILKLNNNRLTQNVELTVETEGLNQNIIIEGIKGGTLSLYGDLSGIVFNVQNCELIFIRGNNNTEYNISNITDSKAKIGGKIVGDMTVNYSDVRVYNWGLTGNVTVSNSRFYCDSNSPEHITAGKNSLVIMGAGSTPSTVAVSKDGGQVVDLRIDPYMPVPEYSWQATDDCVTGNIDKIYSLKEWDEAEVKNVSLKDWGLCSVDNGSTSIDWDKDDLTDIFQNTTLEIEDVDNRFFVAPVKGNFFTDPAINYSINVEEEDGIRYINAEGGFLQGFFELYAGAYFNEIKYSTLPKRHKQVETYEFIINPNSNQTVDGTLNGAYPDNAGIFFFKGTRAENKFWYYNNKLNKENLRCLKDALDAQEIQYLDQYLDIEEMSLNKSKYETLITSENILLNTPHMTEFKTDNKYLFYNRTMCGYTVSDENAPDEVIYTYQNKNDKLNYYLLFNRTKNGLTVSDVEGTCKTCTYWSLYKQYKCDPYLRYNLEQKPYQKFPEIFENLNLYDNNIDINKDIDNNAVAFRITPDGRIGFKNLTSTCEDDGIVTGQNVTVKGVGDCATREINVNGIKMKLTETYSQPNIIEFDKWNYIMVKIVYDEYLDYEKCNSVPPRNGIIQFWVNGLLKFQTPYKEVVLKPLAEHWTKQLGVPYSLSLMGGTQGLLETILSDNPNDYDRYELPMEKYFAGSLIGKMRFFRVSECDVSYSQAQKNFNDFKITRYL